MGFTRPVCDIRPDVSFTHSSARDTKRWVCNRYNKSTLCKSNFEGKESWNLEDGGNF